MELGYGINCRSQVNILLLVVDIEVNYTDDVGQTLLNWASAFGTQEMVVGNHTFHSIIITIVG